MTQARQFEIVDAQPVGPDLRLRLVARAPVK
jgi:hypothetical protein